MGENWDIRGVDTSTVDTSGDESWDIRGRVDSDQREKPAEKQESIDYLLEQFHSLDLQVENIMDGIMEIQADIESAQRANPNNPAYQKSITEISHRVKALKQKRIYIFNINQKIESIVVDYSTWKMSKEQEENIHDINLEILEAKQTYPDDVHFISILSRLQLKLDKLFSI